MAKSTCNPKAEVPSGMKRFEVIRSNIKDSLSQYCVPGDMAVLDEKTARGYHKMNFIRVALPDFDEEVPDETDAADEVRADPPKRATHSRNTGARAGKGRSRASTDS